MSERERFEAYHREVLHPARFSKQNGEYVDPITIRMWKAWQARADLAAKEKKGLEAENERLLAIIKTTAKLGWQGDDNKTINFVQDEYQQLLREQNDDT